MACSLEIAATVYDSYKINPDSVIFGPRGLSGNDACITLRASSDFRLGSFLLTALERRSFYVAGKLTFAWPIVGLFCDDGAPGSLTS